MLSKAGSYISPPSFQCFSKVEESEGKKKQQSFQAVTQLNCQRLVEHHRRLGSPQNFFQLYLPPSTFSLFDGLKIKMWSPVVIFTCVVGNEREKKEKRVLTSLGRAGAGEAA